jgi:translocation and assembly module TamB
LSSSWFNRGLTWLVFAAAGLAGVLIVAAAAFWWWSGTDGSLGWALRHIARWQPVQAEGVQGSLRSGLSAERLRWEQGGLTVEASEVRMEWQPLSLFRGALHLEQLHAARLRVEDRRPPARSTPPEDLALPIRPAIDDFKVGRLDWVTATNSITATDLAGHYSFNGSQHQLQLDSLRWSGGSYRGRASIGATGSLPVDALLEGRYQAAVPGGRAELPLDFSAQFQGPVTDLQAKGRLQVGTGSAAAGTRATATARLMPWAEQPVPQAQAEVRELDLGVFWREAPHTSLSGQLRVQPAGTDAWSLQADLTNGKAGPWDRDRLPMSELNAQGEWQAGGQLLVRELQAQVGGGAVQAHGEWRGAGGWTVQGTAAGVNPAAVYSVMAPVPLSGRVELSGAAQAVAFELDLQARAAAARERGARPAPGSLAATLGALELRQALGRSQPVELNAAFTVGDDAGLLGALFTIEPSHCPDVANSYANWLARQDQRGVQG